MNSIKYEMKRKIWALDFSIYEFILYLDTHPWDKRALMKLHALKKEKYAAIKDYESKFGPYTVTAENTHPDSFTWVNDPWPWEYNKEEV